MGVTGQQERREYYRVFIPRSEHVVVESAREEYRVLDLSTHGLRFHHPDQTFKLGARFDGVLVLKKSRYTVTSIIMHTEANASGVKFEHVLPEDIVNRREYFRLDYPRAEYLALDGPELQCMVREISEAGLRLVMKKGDPQPAVGTEFSGTLHFRDGGTCEIRGRVLRHDGTREAAAVLDKETRIPLAKISREQVYLKAKYTTRR